MTEQELAVSSLKEISKSLKKMNEILEGIDSSLNALIAGEASVKITPDTLDNTLSVKIQEE